MPFGRSARVPSGHDQNGSPPNRTMRFPRRCHSPATAPGVSSLTAMPIRYAKTVTRSNEVAESYA